MMDTVMSLVALGLALVVFGIAIGRFVEKIERFIHDHDDKHRHTKNDRR